MSHELIARNEDLKRLKEAGHTLRLLDGFLVLDEVPYLKSTRNLDHGSLVIKLELSGDRTAQPSDHVAFWTGDFPHSRHGSKLRVLGESSHSQTLSDGTSITHMFSARPAGGRYRDYEHKVLTYIEILEREARAIHPSATAKTWRVDRGQTPDDVFEYMETASARQDTTDIARTLAEDRVAIVGVGGTGSYVLDFVAKTWVKEIHLYDDDRFLQHNAFRSPGATGIEELRGAPNKAEFHGRRYSRVRKGIICHSERIDHANLDEIREYSTVFLCIDGHEIKKQILASCRSVGSICIDTGMGLYREKNSIGGILRTTTSSPGHRDHIELHKRIDMAGGGNGEYERNIQVAELNALNAALAVIKWKKLRGIYQDMSGEGDSGYVLDGNKIVNRDFKSLRGGREVDAVKQ